jgi:hypothetical protein
MIRAATITLPNKLMALRNAGYAPTDAPKALRLIMSQNYQAARSPNSRSFSRVSGNFLTIRINAAACTALVPNPQFLASTRCQDS